MFHDKPPAGWGCSDCGWRFEVPARLPLGNIEDLARRMKEQCDEEFSKHICSQPKGDSGREMAQEES
jgi:hypothetical protein